MDNYATHKMIRARSAKACAVLRRAVSDVNSARSTSSSPSHNQSSPKSGESDMIESIWSPPNFRLWTLGFDRSVTGRTIKVAAILGLDNLKAFRNAVHVDGPR